MRVLMLGWEFPPFMAGGLGTAVFGLTRALNRAGHQVLYVLPKPTGGAIAEHVALYGSDAIAELLQGRRTGNVTLGDPFEGPTPLAGDPAATPSSASPAEPGAPGTRFFPVEAPFQSSYDGGLEAAGTPEAQRLGELVRALARSGRGGPLGGIPTQSAETLGRLIDAGAEEPADAGDADPRPAAGPLDSAIAAAQALGRDNSQYGRDLMGDAARYAEMVAGLARTLEFDVVHAHDWLTYPAGLAVRAVSGKPMVAHVHATEFDRSGNNINQAVYDIERAGITAADRIIVVSKLTRELALSRYGGDEARTDVCYNGVEGNGHQPRDGSKIESNDKIVLFLGRITMQKGPEYFVRAAARVLEKVDNVKFVVAGSGDMAVRMIEHAASLGIGHKVLFTGFLRGGDVDRVYQMADCYVMPSVSEPFGIAALEAIKQDTPAIISKQSGVSEVLTHALKVDFWDVDEMANKIVAVLRHPPLSQTLREHGPMELRALTWDGAAEKVVRTYAKAIAAPR